MKILDGLKKGLRVSEKLITYVEKERRVDDWAQQNIEAILNSRKSQSSAEVPKLPKMPRMPKVPDKQ